MLALVAALAAGCAKTTREGPLGEPIDLSSRWPRGTTAVPTNALASHHCVLLVGEPPARVGVEWKTFEQGGKSLVASVDTKVEQASPGLTLSLPTVDRSDFPAEPDGPPGVVQAVSLSIDWDRSKLTSGTSSSASIELRGDGTFKIP